MSPGDDATQQELETFRAETTTETVTRTVVVPLQSSRRKREKVAAAVKEYQQMTSRLADLLPSYPVRAWNDQNTSLYHAMKREFPKDDRTVGSKVMLGAIQDVVGAFQSWRERGSEGDRPQFGDRRYFAATNQEFTLQANERGFGLKVNFIPYKPEWFHLNTREYHEELLEKVTDGDASLGGGEIHLDESGMRAHLPVRYDVDVYEPGDVNTTVGVDIGESTLYAAVVESPDGIEAVEMESGDEFRHHRDRLDERISRLAEQGDLAGVRACRGDRERYTEQVCHTASKAIVELASEHAPSVIHLEDLTHYRRTAKDPIHDWPFSQLQEQIIYKARDAGIPVQTIDPRNTSITCRRCGQTTPEYRRGDTFRCRRCDYEVHADVNAAINIARGGIEDET